LWETNSRIVSGEEKDGAIKVSCTTLDQVLDGLSDFQPNLLRLDVQGFELEAMVGSERHLKQFEVIILEVSVLRIGDVPIFSEVDQFMDARGYRLYDLLPQYYRPRDGALWQMDVFYVRQDSALIASRNWD
jgi:Methyltransferase FkbM domain